MSLTTIVTLYISDSILISGSAKDHDLDLQDILGVLDFFKHFPTLQNAEAAYYAESRKSPELFAREATNTRIQLSVPVSPQEQQELITAALISGDDGDDVRRKESSDSEK